MRSSKTCSNEHYMEHQAIPVGPSEAFQSNHVMFDDCVINIGSGRRLPRETRDDQVSSCDCYALAHLSIIQRGRCRECKIDYM